MLIIATCNNDDDDNNNSNRTAVAQGSIDPAIPFQGGSCGNYLIVPFDKEKGIKVLCDRVIRVERGMAQNYAAADKESHTSLKLFIRRKRSRPIVFDNLNNILNNYLAVYITPYDSYGSLTTDNVASIALTYRLYFKDP